MNSTDAATYTQQVVYPAAYKAATAAYAAGQDDNAAYAAAQDAAYKAAGSKCGCSAGNAAYEATVAAKAAR